MDRGQTHEPEGWGFERQSPRSVHFLREKSRDLTHDHVAVQWVSPNINFFLFSAHFWGSLEATSLPVRKNPCETHHYRFACVGSKSGSEGGFEPTLI